MPTFGHWEDEVLEHCAHGVALGHVPGDDAAAHRGDRLLRTLVGTQRRHLAGGLHVLLPRQEQDDDERDGNAPVVVGQHQDVLPQEVLVVADEGYAGQGDFHEA